MGTVSVALEHALVHSQPKSYFVYRLDGDDLRFGINKDLGFSPADRKENVRRVAEVSKLFAEAGAIVIAGLISPYAADRQYAREVHLNASLPFMEVFIDAPLNVVEDRDPKGLYKKAREGRIKGFTGIDAPYERPEKAEIHVRTDQLSITQSVNLILKKIDEVGLHIQRTFRPLPDDEPQETQIYRDTEGLWRIPATTKDCEGCISEGFFWCASELKCVPTASHKCELAPPLSHACYANYKRKK